MHSLIRCSYNEVLKFPISGAILKSNQLGTREGSPVGAMLLNMLPADWLPKAQ